MIDEKKVKLILGKRGSGKSHLVHQLIADIPRLLIFDPQAEYTEGIVFEPEDYRKMLLCMGLWGDHRFRFIYRPINPPAEVGRIAKLAFAVGRLTLVTEEIEVYATATSIDPNLLNLIARGRHRDIELIATSQRPHHISKLVTSQAKEIYIFSTNEPRDVDYLKELIGSDIEPRLVNLRHYPEGYSDYLYWNE